MPSISTDTFDPDSDQASRRDLSAQLGRMLLERGLMVTAAESCTGGLIASAITDIAGSSEWFEQGLVTYSNAAKQALLGVDEAILDSQGAVSKACVLAMAKGALHSSGADIAVSVSGIAGPGGATEGKPVGTVWVAWISANRDFLDAEMFCFVGNRQQIREQAVLSALRGIIARIKNTGNSA